MACFCYFSFGKNLDFQDFVQKKFYNINYWSWFDTEYKRQLDQILFQNKFNKRFIRLGPQIRDLNIGLKMMKILEDQIPLNAPRYSASGMQWKTILRILLLNRMYVKLIRYYYLLCAFWDWGLAKYYFIIFSLNLLKRQFSWLGAVNAQWIRLLLPSCDTVFESQTHHLCFLRYKMQQYLCKKGTT